MSEVDQIPTTAVTAIGQVPIDEDASAEQGGADKLVAFAREHPVLVIAGGLAVGALAAAVFRGRSTRRGTGPSFAQRAVALAAAAGEVGLTLSRQARETAEQAAQEGRKRITQDSAVVRQRASRLAQDARGTGKRLADEARKLASRGNP